MYIYHLYFMLQGLAALYFISVTVPNVALDLYTLYIPTLVPTPFAAHSTSGSSTAVITDADNQFIYIPNCSTAQLDDFNHSQSLGVSSLPTSQTHPPQSVLPPGVIEQPQDTAVDSATYPSSSVPLEAITMQGSSSMFNSGFCLLALGMVLGTLGTRRLVRSSSQQLRDAGTLARTNSNWLLQVLPESIAESKMLEDRQVEDQLISQTDIFGLWPRLRGSDIFSGFAVPSTLTAVPSRVIVQRTRASKRTKDVTNPQATDLLESSGGSDTPSTTISTPQPIAVSYEHPNIQTSSIPAKGQINPKTPIESKPVPLNVSSDSQSAKQSIAVPSRNQFPLVPNFGPSIFVTPPFGRMISTEHNTWIESRSDAAKPVAVCDVSEGAMSNEKPATLATMQPAVTSPAHLCATVTTPFKEFRTHDSDFMGGMVPESSPLTPAHSVHVLEHVEQTSSAPHVDTFDTSSSEGSLGPVTPDIPLRQLHHGTPAMVASINPYIGRVLKEFDSYNSQNCFDKSLDTRSPTRLIKQSSSFGSFPGLFASPHASASDLVTLIATPISFPPWKFDELMPPAAPLQDTCTVPNDRPKIALEASRPSDPKLASIPSPRNKELSPHLDTQTEGRPKEIGNLEWEDKALDEQELRWRSIMQPQSPKPLENGGNFWMQFESNTFDDSDQSSCWWTPNESA